MGPKSEGKINLMDEFCLGGYRQFLVTLGGCFARDSKVATRRAIPETANPPTYTAGAVGLSKHQLHKPRVPGRAVACPNPRLNTWIRGGRICCVTVRVFLNLGLPICNMSRCERTFSAQPALAGEGRHKGLPQGSAVSQTPKSPDHAQPLYSPALAPHRCKSLAASELLNSQTSSPTFGGRGWGGR